MRVLVTGATGFAGRHLITLLERRQHEIYGTYLVRSNVPFHQRIELFQCDLRQRERVFRAVRKIRPERVYHLAAFSSVQESLKSPRTVYENNLIGTLNLLEALRHASPNARILLVGSGQCYGKVSRKRLPITESEILRPENPYSASKAAADLLGYQFSCSYRMWVIRARPFNHTGPGQSAEFVCSDFARQMAEIDLGFRPPLLRVGNLNAVRDFSDVRDVAHAYELLLRKGEPGEAYNVCRGQTISMKEVVETLRSFVSKAVKVVVERARVRSQDLQVLCGSHHKLSAATGWRPFYEIDTTLQDLYTYWKRELQKPETGIRRL